ncbi:hypothetical protein OPV22_007372 [Ensete ventricosum]|uniref:Uncharacterized protein n=1 Tax=Ensete ventricosum TaxID=4639 RepID=A0AAV8Q8F0_ENSVE|nr:hypothetical protein OPV22_007372 [Ensete ventricosum]
MDAVSAEGSGRGRTGDGEQESLNRLQELARGQHLLDSSTRGFGAERLERLVGPAATGYTSELEDLYGKMLLKLESFGQARGGEFSQNLRAGRPNF